MPVSPTVPPPAPDSLSSTLRRNIAVLRQRREDEEKSATFEERTAERISRFAGSMRFVYLHAVLYGFWIAANIGLVPAIEPWDPTLVVLAMIASVEAIFLSTFILIGQNRMAASADRRAELDLQISLLAEREITKLVELVSDIAARIGVEQPNRAEIEEMKREVAPEAVLDVIQRNE
jgi:uncharacterized membrane protein